jgi:hypothetical protein
VSLLLARKSVFGYFHPLDRSVGGAATFDTDGAHCDIKKSG